MKQLAALSSGVTADDRGILLGVLDGSPREDRNQIEPGDAIVEHDNSFPTKPKYPMDFRNRLFRVDGVVKHTVRVHDIERAVGKIQCLSVTNLNVSLIAFPAQVGLRQLEQTVEDHYQRRNRSPRLASPCNGENLHSP